MDHHITYNPVSNGPGSKKFRAIQCHSEDHGLAQIVLIPRINAWAWEHLAINFLLNHLNGDNMPTEQHDVEKTETSDGRECYICHTPRCKEESAIRKPYMNGLMWVQAIEELLKIHPCRKVHTSEGKSTLVRI